MMADEPDLAQVLVEQIARIIDPEAFGLPNPFYEGNSDRDEAREKARAAISAIQASISNRTGT